MLWADLIFVLKRGLRCALLSVCAAASAQPLAPAQQPLLSRSAGSVAPLVLLTMDDSGSMASRFLPEGAVRMGRYFVPMPNVIYPTGPYNTNYPRFQPGDFNPGDPLIAGVPGTNNWRQTLLRSPDTNWQYYDPQLRYRPWIKADGTRYPEAVPSRAVLDPSGSPAGSVDLTLVLDRYQTHWCYPPISGKGNGGDACTGEPQAFDPGLYYRLRKDTTGAWLNPQDAANYDEFSVNRPGSFLKSPARTDCAGTTCTQAEERQNFANWFVYHRSRILAAKAGLGKALYEANGPMRLGWGRINKGKTLIDGQLLSVLESGVRDYTAPRKAAALSWLYGISPDGGTPLREAVQEVGAYLKSAAPGGPWSDDPGGATPSSQGQSCRRAFHVLVTDGDWTGGGTDGTAAVFDKRIGVALQLPGNSDGTSGPLIRSGTGRSYQYQPTRPYQDQRANMLADVAMELWKNDLQPDIPNNVSPNADNPSFWQNLTHFTVGFGVQGLLDRVTDWPALQAGTKEWVTGPRVALAAKIDDLWHTAVNSRGEYFSARNATHLNTALSTALASATSRELMEAGVATASSVLEANNRKYVPNYKPGTWSGDVVALQLDASGQAGTQLWSARKQLPAWASRTIVTWDTGLTAPKGVPFAWASLSAAARSALGATADSALVDYLRGDRSREDATAGFRVREHVLGDFVNTTPVLAGGVADADLYKLPDIGGTYGRYINSTKSTRTGVLWVGGNDGMLHAFRDGRGASALDGREIFAYVPRAVWGKLSALAARGYGSAASPHQYFVDGPLVERDVHVKAPGADTPSWRNYLFGSTGAGARAVFALDITDPDALGNTSIRWEISSDTQPELGHVLFPIESGPLPDGRWVAVFGNGYGSDGGKASLFVVDVASGAVSRLPVDETTANNGLGGVTALRNASGQIVRLYAGDLAGQLWRFDYDANAGAVGFKLGLGGKALFNAPAGQPIMQPPAVFAHGQSGQVVVFGTGRLITGDDLTTIARQSIYGVRDTDAGAAQAPWTAANLMPRQIGVFTGASPAGDQGYLTLTGADLDWSAMQGWRIDLDVPGFTGLRVIYPPQKASPGFVLVSAVSPASSGQTCESAVGRAINLLMPVMSGATSAKPVFDTNGDGLINTRDTAAAGYFSNADGVDAILQGGVVNAPGTGGQTGSACQQISIQNTTGQTTACVPLTPPAPATVRSIKDRIWRRILTPPIR